MVERGWFSLFCVSGRQVHEDINSGIERGILWALCQLCSGREQEDGTGPGHLQAAANSFWRFLQIDKENQSYPSASAVKR